MRAVRDLIAYLDLEMVSPVKHSRSLDFERLFFRFELRETFSKMASLDLERYRFRSVALFLHVWHDLEEQFEERGDFPGKAGRRPGYLREALSEEGALNGDPLPPAPPPLPWPWRCPVGDAGPACLSSLSMMGAAGILSMSGEGDGGSSSSASSGCCSSSCTVGRSLLVQSFVSQAALRSL